MNHSSTTSASIEISFPSELGYEIVARDAIGAFAERMGFSKARLEDLKTALSEVCINAIEHGNLLNACLRVDVICLCDEQHLCIEVRDQGLRHFKSGHQPLDITEKIAGLGSLRGMGLMLITQLSDDAGFVKSRYEGNSFRFTFNR